MLISHVKNVSSAEVYTVLHGHKISSTERYTGLHNHRASSSVVRVGLHAQNVSYTSALSTGSCAKCGLNDARTSILVHSMPSAEVSKILHDFSNVID